MKRKGLRLLHCLLKCLMVLPLLACSARGDEISPFVESLVQKAESWKTTPLPGDWKALAGPPNASRKETLTAEPLFGQVAQRIVATEEGGKLTRLDVLFMERGAAAADEAYLAAMRQAASKASAGVQAQVGKPGSTVKPAAGSALGTVVQEWAGVAATIRLTMEPASRLYVSILPLQTQAATAAGAQAKPAALKSRLEEKANGDVIITGLPEVAPVKGEAPGCVEVAQCLAGYYGWTISVEDVATTAGWTPESSIDKTYSVMTALAKVARVEVIQFNIKTGYKLDPLEIRRWIDKGRPVVYRHAFSKVRKDYLLDFNKQFEQNPNLELPSPKDPGEKSKWPRWEASRNYSTLGGLIIGYNKKRGELILNYTGYSSGNQILRMREEELAASAFQIHYISPN